MLEAEQQRPHRERAAGTGRRDVRPERTADRPPLVPRPRWWGLFLEPPPWPDGEEEGSG